MGSLYEGKRKSLSKLKELRRREFVADPSYDLNGDGTVSQKEMLIASKFDKNRDGILTTEERTHCLQALQNDLESQKKYADDYALAQALNSNNLRIAPENRTFSVSALQKQPQANMTAEKRSTYMGSLGPTVRKGSGKSEPRKYVTRTELLSSRRRGLKEYEDVLFQEKSQM